MFTFRFSNSYSTFTVFVVVVVVVYIELELCVHHRGDPPLLGTEAMILMNGSIRPLAVFDSQWLAACSPLRDSHWVRRRTNSRRSTIWINLLINMLTDMITFWLNVTLRSIWELWEWILKDRDIGIRKLFIELKLKKNQ